jgi:hypothetical protein
LLETVAASHPYRPEVYGYKTPRQIGAFTTSPNLSHISFGITVPAIITPLSPLIKKLADRLAKVTGQCHNFVFSNRYLYDTQPIGYIGDDEEGSRA